MRESHLMNNKMVMLLPYFISIRPEIVKLRSGATKSRTKRGGSGEDYIAIEFASFLIDLAKLTESESTCHFDVFKSKSQIEISDFHPRPVEYLFDMYYDSNSDYLSRLRPVFNIIMHVTKESFQRFYESRANEQHILFLSECEPQSMTVTLIK